jgi:hypothetical protein
MMNFVSKIINHYYQKFLVTLFMLGIAGTPVLAQAVFSAKSGGYRFNWDLKKDSATLKTEAGGQIWKGSLLPAFWLQNDKGEKQYVKAALADAAGLNENGGTVRISLGTLGTGTIELVYHEGIVSVKELAINWKNTPPKIISLYFGTSLLKAAERARTSDTTFPFWPDWQSAGVCIPSAKGNPIQSFFRMWDLGNATLPLGSFGPSLGTPYAAAYPRPFYSCAMGSDAGWIVFGAGSIPDAAMVYKIQSSNGCLQYLYREDLWSKSTPARRIWKDPLRISWAPKAYDAYQAYFQTFGDFKPVSAQHQLNVWNTWGDFKNRNFNLKAIADKALEFKADILAIDDSWETSTGTGTWYKERFPDYEKDLNFIRQKGLETGYWQNVIYLTKPEDFGLNAEDLLCGIDGKPIQTSWNMNPHEGGFFCLDPSSPKAVALIRDRTIRVMRELKPDLLKLDFGYGIPSPDVATARDPALRGESLAYSLLKLVSDAAREINPEVTIQYYSIHPLLWPVQNLLALDDLGDAGGYEVQGHGQWSIWSSLAGRQGMAIMASSGYNWDADDEVLLNTAIIGGQSAVLSQKLEDGSPVPVSKISKRVALALWHRKSVGWTPLWLNSEKGTLLREPEPNCWGRLENNRLTALALRESNIEFDRSAIKNISWKGKWAIISQDDQSIFESKKVALVPFEGGWIEIPFAKKPVKVVVVSNSKEVPAKSWKWANSRLRIDVAEQSPDQARNGFLIYQ